MVDTKKERKKRHLWNYPHYHSTIFSNHIYDRHFCDDVYLFKKKKFVQSKPFVCVRQISIYVDCLLSFEWYEEIGKLTCSKDVNWSSQIMIYICSIWLNHINSGISLCEFFFPERQKEIWLISRYVIWSILMGKRWKH